jgi:hypothetical protein
MVDSCLLQSVAAPMACAKAAGHDLLHHSLTGW